MILPWITLAIVSAAVYSRLSRSSLLETLGQDHIRTARSKGMPERHVVLRHGLRSSLTPGGCRGAHDTRLPGHFRSFLL